MLVEACASVLQLLQILVMLFLMKMTNKHKKVNTVTTTPRFFSESTITSNCKHLFFSSLSKGQLALIGRERLIGESGPHSLQIQSTRFSSVVSVNVKIGPVNDSRQGLGINSIVVYKIFYTVKCNRHI